MKERDKRFIENWKKTKSQGFKKYAFTHGLGFGIIITIFNLLFIHFGDGNDLSVEKFIIVAVTMIVAVGFSYAGVTWLMNEYIYNKKVNKK